MGGACYHGPNGLVIESYDPRDTSEVIYFVNSSMTSYFPTAYLVLNVLIYSVLEM